MGGIGAERQVSIQSGICVARALAEAGFDVVTADIRPDRLDILDEPDIDVFFPALHGKFGEDGKLQQILEDKALVYTGSGPEASRLAFDKVASKKVFVRAAIPTPAGISFHGEHDLDKLEEDLKKLADKYVVKPNTQGSSVGVRIVRGARKAIEVAQETLSRFNDCIIEEFIRGREVTVGVLCDRPLPIIEIRTENGFYDYEAKYIDDATEYLCDPIDRPDLAQRIQASAIDCFGALGCRHFARVDFILADDDTAYVLEVNTIPGFTTHSLLPKAAKRMGLSMSDLCAKIVEAARSGLEHPRTQDPMKHRT